MKIDEIKLYARDNNVPIMMEDGLRFLLDYVKEHPIHSILEVGTAIGYSSICMASIREDIEIDTIEINPKMAEEAKKNIEINQMENRIHVHLSDAMEYETDAIYDLIFIDAAKAQYHRYYDHFKKNSHAKTVFVFDNLNFHGIVDNPEMTKNRNTKSLVKKIKIFRDWLQDNDELYCEFHSTVGDGVAVCTKKEK